MHKDNPDAGDSSELKQRELPAQYSRFFEEFNAARFFEAHDVLEPIWLAKRQHADGLFYKGLIQLAGAFVHIRKGRGQPAAALFRLAHTHLAPYAPACHELEIGPVLALIQDWLEKLQQGGGRVAPEDNWAHPCLHLTGVLPPDRPGGA